MTKIKETSTNFANKKALADECPEIYASNIIGGQWALAICCYLINGKMRFGELRKKLQNITERMLTLQLRRLEEDILQQNVQLTRRLHVTPTVAAVTTCCPAGPLVDLRPHVAAR